MSAVVSSMWVGVVTWGEGFLARRVWGLSLAAWGFVATGWLAFTGLLWDGAWHASWGRDTFFIPPHDLMYGGIALATAISIGIIVTASRRPRDPSMIHFGKVQAPLGIWIALVGVTIMYSGAAYDDWWHRNIGHVEGDIVLWSPPHFIGMFGALLALAGGVLFILPQVLTPKTRDGKPVLFWQKLDMPNIGLLMLFCWFASQIAGMSLDRWLIYDKLRFEGSTYPILAMLFGPALLVVAQRLSNRAGAATFVVIVPFLWSAIVGMTLRGFGVPKMASLPIMAIPSALLLDIAFARFGMGKRWLLFFGPVFVLTFYASEFLWAWYLTRYPWWPLDKTFLMMPVGIVVGTASLLMGAWIADGVEKILMRQEAQRVRARMKSNIVQEAE